MCVNQIACLLGKKVVQLIGFEAYAVGYTVALNQINNLRRSYFYLASILSVLRLHRPAEASED